MTVEIGVVAFRIAAREEAMWLWPHTIKQKGTTLLRRPMPKNAHQAARVPGMFMPSARTRTLRITAANPTRKNTMVNAGKLLTKMPTKKNEPPHNTDNRSSISHSFLFMLRLTIVPAAILPRRKFLW